jgi:choline kinase
MLPVILAAGLGKRLGGIPKALFELSGEPLILRAARELAAQGHDRLVVLTGHGAEEVEAFWAQAAPPLDAKFVFNERYADLNNFHTVAVACEQLDAGELMFLNSDIVFLGQTAADAAAVESDLVLSIEAAHTDEEAMGVRVEGDRVLELGKHIHSAQSYGEFIGISSLTDRGREVYLRAAGEALRAGEANLYYEDIYSRIAEELGARLAPAAHSDWAEIDAPEDVPRAEKVAALQDGAAAR